MRTFKNAKYIKDVDTDKNSSIEATFDGEKVFVPLVGIRRFAVI